jgi:hypothetical protein
MYIRDLFDILSEGEKELMYDLCRIWKKQEEEKRKKLREENKKILLDLSDNKMSARLLTALLDYYENHKVNEELMLEHICLKNVRNIGKVGIEEFNKLFFYNHE